MHTIFWLEKLKEETTQKKRDRWEHNIMINFRPIGWEVVE
jgi:hypothetical protein